MRATTALLLAAASTASAHFTLTYPSPLGNNAKQGTAPCGGHTVSASTQAEDFYVDSDFISLKSSHPESRWTFSLTSDETLSADGNWTAVQAPILQSGLGEFCTEIGGMEDWVGQKAVLQVKEDKSDGELYSCAYVNLVAGSRDAAPGNCKNGTGVSAAFEGGAADDEAAPTGTEEEDSTASETEAETSPSETGAGNRMSAIGAAVVGGAAAMAALLL